MIALFDAKVFHARLRPAQNSFRYGAAYLAIPLDEFTKVRRGVLSIDGPNLFGVRTRDYGDGKSAKDWIAKVLEDWRISEADGPITLITMPRIFGCVFNPVNFWLCKDRAGNLRAVLAEVSNTFGERHCYLCFHQDHHAIAPADTLTAQKIFHVSPFLATKGDYTFRFSVADDRLAIMIDLSDENGPLLRTSLAGTLKPATSGRLLRTLFASPLMPVKTIALIHYQAVKLFLKRVRHTHKPTPPAKAISGSHEL
ncbi:MAG TPA: DUF1365 domain-containing protein [Rhizomicrobium sp.]|nr:DUF1365 domain-containing protein [Rhizomicrobium sp.]